MKTRISHTRVGRLTITLFGEDYELYNAFGAGCPLPEKDKKYMVGVKEYVGPNRNGKQPYVIFQDDNGEGWSGNSDHTIKRYHGWRGTTNDWAFYGHGVRTCIEIKKIRRNGLSIYFGKDMVPEED